MAKATRLSLAARNGALDSIARRLDGGTFELRSGTKPADPDAAITDGVLISSHAIQATSAPAASGGSLTFNLPADDTSADNGAAPTFYRAKSSGGVAVIDGTAGLTAADPNAVINVSPVVVGDLVKILSWSLSLPNSGL